VRVAVCVSAAVRVQAEAGGVQGNSSAAWAGFLPTGLGPGRSYMRMEEELPGTELVSVDSLGEHRSPSPSAETAADQAFRHPVSCIALEPAASPHDAPPA
jgi:hypothetical protein